MKKLSLLLAFLFISVLSFAQQEGYIEGRIKDGQNNPIKKANIVAKSGGIEKGRTESDNFGKYLIKPLSAGEYTLEITYQGKKTTRDGVSVSNGSGTTENVIISTKTSLGGAIVTGQSVRPKIKLDESKAGQSLAVDAKKIEKMATTNTVDAAALKGGVYQAKTGSGAIIGGGRVENTIYVIDGVITRNGEVQLPFGSVQEIAVQAGGLSAAYGDATGGVIAITSKGPSANHSGNINYQGSVDGFYNNQLNVNLRGPLWKKRLDSVNKGRTILGYTIGASAQYDVDPDPSYFKYWGIKPALLDELKKNPLVAVTQPGGAVVYRSAAEYITADDMVRLTARQNGDARSINLNGKLDFSPTKDINITLGGNGLYRTRLGYSTVNSIFAPDANAQNNTLLGRGYIRFRQTLSKEVKGEKNLIGKAYYSVQLNYENTFNSSKHNRHGDNIFAYGYLGKFKQYQHDFYNFDTVAGGYRGLRNLGTVSDSVTFQSDESYNPNFTAYTNYLYNNIDRKPSSLNQLRQFGGLANGDAPPSVHGLFTGVGSNVGGLNKSVAEQYSLNVDASFDINTGIKRSEKLNRDLESRHAIEFGLYYEQRVNRSYSLNARTIWELMRVSANQHILNYDFSQPIFRVDGKDYSLAEVQAGAVTVSQFDTINYQRKLSAENPESFFSKNLRSSLGLGASNRDFLFIDELDPTKLKLDMFSADDLFNQGSAYVGYSGYDYLGNKTKGRPSFEDFWKKKDANGNYARPVAPFNPIYVAGYIQDNFKFKDIRFRIGVRVDRYDANQKVLRDPYTLVAAHKVSDLKPGSYTLADNVGGTAKGIDPLTNTDFNSKFGDATVYVADNVAAQPKIVGYRLGDVWYDPFGLEIADPSIINATYTGGNQLAPYVINKADIKKDRIKDADFDLNSAFTDYKPRINVSPRITFSFPVDVDSNGNTKSLFYAHYDVVTQRPNAGAIFATPDDYYFISERGQSQTLANANLSPEKKVDYEFGFQQQLSKSSQMKIAAAYIERRNQVQLQRFTAAYPLTYETYGNRDFSTVKQLIVEYDLRPEKFPVEVSLAYTLQFAEGTGSNSTSQRSLLASGQPNLRQVQPLDIDSRHTIVLNTDYRIGDVEGNRGFKMLGKYPLKNTGVNFTFNARSGEPFTKLAFVQSLTSSSFNGSPIEGTLNGSRRPWSFTMNTRFDKDFMINRRKKLDAEGKLISRKPRVISAYCSVQNLFNTRNVLAVYNFTGDAENDGFLASPQGIQNASSILTSADSWSDMYNIRLRDPGRFVNPRRIFLGFNYNF